MYRGEDDYFVDGKRLGERNEPGGVVGCADLTTQAVTRGRGTCKGEIAEGADKEQESV